MVRLYAPISMQLVQGDQAQALGRSHGGFSTNVKAEGYSKPMYFVLTGGERHETVAFQSWSRVERSNDSEGPPKHRSRYLAGQSIQQPRHSPTGTANWHYSCHSTGNQKRQGRFNRGLYQERNRVERLINRLKQYRRITRYESMHSTTC